MHNILLRYVFDRKKESSKTKQGLLQIEVRIKGTDERIFISTGIKLYKNQFSDSLGFTCKNHDLADAITNKGRKIFSKIESFTLSDKCRSLTDVKNWNKTGYELHSVIDFIEKEMRLRNMKYNTLKAHITLKNKLNNFGKIKIFDDITHTNIVAFDQFIREKQLANVSINKIHTLFNMYIKEAINKEYLTKNPYNTFTPPKAKSTEPVFLTEEEVGKIKNVKNLSDRLERVKDLFLFQCFTGMSYIDMQNFSKDEIQIQDKNEIIRSSRIKTDESFILLFLPAAKAIAEKYNYNLPKISNQKYNDYLKLLMVHPDINISKNVTTHSGRHTFATYLINKEIPLESVSKILGHSNIKQSQHYARLLGKKVISDMKKLL